METKRLVRTFIVDDDAAAAALLRRQLEDYSVEIVGLAQDANQATLDQISELEPDLLFLDVELPSMSGLDFCTKIRPLVKPEMKVVFYTGYDKYMLEALRREAFDYMLKPASRQELAKIMTRYYENKLSNIQPVVGKNITATPPSVMIVNAINEHTVLRFQDIVFFRFDGERRLWEVFTVDGVSQPLRHRTTADIILAYSKDFVQIHKRYIVNVNKISRILDQQIVLCDPLSHITELKISKNYRHDLMATFYNM
ncbi:MAG: response regulator transcription factor [Prevotella sp.]|nr:response regulator transcription factor [Prevotella sp.]